MGSYRFSESADLSPERVFEYLSDVRNLPRYLPQMTAAEPVGGDRVKVEAQVDGRTEAGEAWVREEPAEHRSEEFGSEGPSDYYGTIEWGSESENEYYGKLVITGDGPDRCTIEVDLHTIRAEGDEIEQGVRHTVDGLIKAIRAKTDAAEH
jgi:hypothetical protein